MTRSGKTAAADMLAGGKLLPVHVVSDRLSLSKKTVYRLIDQGDLEAVRTTRKKGLRVFEAELSRYVTKKSTNK